MNSKGEISIIAVIIASLIVGAGAGFYVARTRYVSQINALESKLEKVAQIFPSVSETRVITGTVKSVNGNVLNIETPASPNPLEDWPTNREVSVTDKTRIVKNEQKSAAVFQKELADYEKAITNQHRVLPGAAPTNSPASPVPFVEKELKITDLKAGDQIAVEAGENIKSKTSFEAVKITVQGGGTGGVGPNPASLAPALPLPSPPAAGPNSAGVAVPPPPVPPAP